MAKNDVSPLADKRKRPAANSAQPLLLKWISAAAATNFRQADVSALGIDLGTTNTVAAIASYSPETRQISVFCPSITQHTQTGEHIGAIVPSVVAVTCDGTCVGEGARRLRFRSIENGLADYKTVFAETKNHIGTRKAYALGQDGLVDPTAVAASILKHVIADQSVRDIQFHRTVITVPASFGPAQRQATRNAATSAEIALLRGDLLDEPTGALIAHLAIDDTMLADSQQVRVLVFDFGGGTCDITVSSLYRAAAVAGDGQAYVNLSLLAASRYTRLGGADINRAITHQVLIPQLEHENGIAVGSLHWSERQQCAVALDPIAENLKILICDDIAQAEAFGQPADDLIATHAGVETIEIVKRRFTLTEPKLRAADFGKIMSQFVDPDELQPNRGEYCVIGSVLTPVRETVERAKLSNDDINYVLLAGGSSRIPHVQAAMKSFFPRAEIISFGNSDDDLRAIAKGAAINALAKACGLQLVVQTASSSISIRTEGGSAPLFAAGTALPAAINLKLSAPTPGTNEDVEVRVEVVVDDGVSTPAFTAVWNLSGPVDPSEPLDVSAVFDEDSVLTLRIGRPKRPTLPSFEAKIENPLTYVVNPSADEMLVADLELKLQSASVVTKLPLMLDLIWPLGRLGHHDRAIEIAEAAIAGASPKHLSSMQFILACALAAKHDTPGSEAMWSISAGGGHSDSRFRLTISLLDRGAFGDALVQSQMLRNEVAWPEAAVLEARALVGVSRNDEAMAICVEALPDFGPVERQDRVRLSWYIVACRIAREHDMAQIAQRALSALPTKPMQDTAGALPWATSC